MKHLIASLLTLCMVLSIVPATDTATDHDRNEGISTCEYCYKYYDN